MPQNRGYKCVNFIVSDEMASIKESLGDEATWPAITSHGLKTWNTNGGKHALARYGCPNASPLHTDNEEIANAWAFMVDLLDSKNEEIKRLKKASQNR